MPRLLLTRPRAQSESFAASLPDDWQASIWPVVEIVPTDFDPRPAREARTLILTSARAAEALAALSPLDKPAWCVGPATAGAAERIGAAPLEGGGDAETLTARILAAPDAGPYLHARGREARVDIAARLRAAGRRAESLVVYRAEEPGPAPAWLLEDIDRGDLNAAAFFSPRSASIFARRMREAGAALGRLRAVAISPAAAAPLEGLGFGAVEIASRPDAAAMRAALCGAA